MQDKLRIRLITNNFPPEISSSAHIFSDLAMSLAERGHTVDVLTSFPRKYNIPGQGDFSRFDKGIMRIDEERGVKVRRIRTPIIPKDVLFLRGMEMFLDPIVLSLALIFGLSKNKSDVVLVYSPPLPLAASVLLLGKIRGIPIISNIQDLYPKSIIDVGLLKSSVLTRIFEIIERFVYSNSTILTVHSKGNKQYIEEKTNGLASVRLIHNCCLDGAYINPPSSSPIIDDLREKFIVTFAGIMSYGQGLDVVIEAAELLRTEDSIFFLLVGDGTEKKRLMQMAQKLGLRNIRFLDFQDRESYSRLALSSDIMLVTLRKDISPQVIPGKIQSIMQMGRPIVACIPLKGDAAEMIKNANSGICCDAENAGMLARVIIELKNDPGKREEFSINGKEFADKYLTIQAFTDSYEKVFREAIDMKEEQGR